MILVGENFFDELQFQIEHRTMEKLGFRDLCIGLLLSSSSVFCKTQSDFSKEKYIKATQPCNKNTSSSINHFVEIADIFKCCLN